MLETERERDGYYRQLIGIDMRLSNSAFLGDIKWRHFTYREAFQNQMQFLVRLYSDI